MAITHLLEKMLLSGHAKNRIHHIAYGMFSQIQIPTDSFIVIHKIYWNGWINQNKLKYYDMTWREFFRFNEYQLKVKSDKESPLFYIFRNEINMNVFSGTPLNLATTINQAEFEKFILLTPKKPIIFDTWITAYDYLNFTISRNYLMPESVNFNPVNNYAEEKSVPDGINGQNVILQLNLLGGASGTTETVNPPSPKTTPATMPQNNVSNYNQILDKPNGNDNGSFLNDPVNSTPFLQSEYANNPLISFEYCIIQKNAAGNLSSL